MRAFYSDHFVLPLPDGHKFPMAKYSRLRERILAEGTIAPDQLQEAPAADWDDLRLVHDPVYVEAVANGTVPADVQRRIGFPWSPQMVERARRSAMLQDTPTVQEAGLAGFVVNSGFGLVGPGGMPKAVVDSINGALAKAVQDAAVRKAMIDNGADPAGGTPEQHDAYIKSEVAKWIKVVNAAGLKPE